MDYLNLQLFADGDGTGAGGAPSGQAAPGAAPAAPQETAKAPEGTQTQPADEQPKSPEARRAEFEKLIRGDYKDLFDERAQQIIDRRFKQTKGLEEQVNGVKPVLDLLASKYGVDPSDIKALSKAVTEDHSFYEDAAAQAGLTVEQYKQIKTLEMENAQFKRAAQERERQANADRIFAQWTQQGEALKAMYPTFDLKAECENAQTGERFMGLIGAGIDVKTAFQTIHQDEILAGAMQYTAQKVREKTVNDIAARGNRPTENGAGGQATAINKGIDITKMTKAERDAISRRALAGAEITFRGNSG